MAASPLTMRQLALICVISVIVLFFALRPGDQQSYSGSWVFKSPASAQSDAGGLNMGGLNLAGLNPAGGLTINAQAAGKSVPITTQGDVGFNVLAALDASGGALRDVTIAPGATWSFNATVGNPAGVEIRTVGGVPGGGWCDLAARYVQAVRPLLSANSIKFVNHVDSNGISLADVSYEDAVSIWNIGGQAGSQGGAQDLEITNTLPHAIHLQALPTPDGSAVMVLATILDS